MVYVCVRTRERKGRVAGGSKKGTSGDGRECGAVIRNLISGCDVGGEPGGETTIISKRKRKDDVFRMMMMMLEVVTKRASEREREKRERRAEEPVWAGPPDGLSRGWIFHVGTGRQAGQTRTRDR